MYVEGTFPTMSPAASTNNTTAPLSTSFAVFSDAQYWTTISGALSICGAIFIFVTYFLWKDIRTNSRRILVYISFADLMVACCHIAGIWYIPPIGACVGQAFFTVFATNSSTFWTAAMAIYLHVITARRQIQLAQKMMFWFHIICWFVPLTIALVALLLGTLGRSGFFGAAGWCWIQTAYYGPNTSLSHLEQVLWMVLTNYVWKIIAFCIIIILYTLLRMKLREAMAVYSNSRDHSERRAYDAAAASDRKLMLVPLLFIFLYIWGLMRFFVFVFYPVMIYQSKAKWLTTVQGVGDTSQGFTNFLLYCFLTKRFMEPLKRCCLSCNCCRRRYLRTTGEDLSAVSSTINDSTIEIHHGDPEHEPFLNARKPNYKTSEKP